MQGYFSKSFIFLLLILYSLSSFSTDILNHKVEKYSTSKSLKESGDQQSANIENFLDRPLKVIVTNNSNYPVKNYPVKFSLLTKPSGAENFKIKTFIVYTDTLGIASTEIKLGSKPGMYQVAATIKSGNAENFKIFQVYARKSNWVLMLIFGLLGGLALFLFGMNLTSEGMQKAAGDGMRTILSKLTNNRIIAVGVGVFVTVVVQSSSATTVMLISFVQSGLLKFSQTLGIILGADIGTTVTTQLIAFKLTDYSLLLIGIGFILYFFVKKDKLKSIGETIFGFGIIFFGMYIMSEAMEPLKSYEPFIDSLVKLDNPLLGILAGTLATALIQSSGAFIGIVIILSMQGFINLETGIPLILGSNIGTAITAVIASINTNSEAKKVAIAHTLFKILGVLLFAWWIPYFAKLTEWFSPDTTNATSNQLSQIVPRQLANAHTIFNILMTLIFLPFVNLFAKYINKLIPEKKIKPEDAEPCTLLYLDENMLETPALALNLAKQETLRMGNIVKEMLKDIIVPFTEKRLDTLINIDIKEKEINFLRDKINSYLIRISQEKLEKERVDEAFQIMFTVKELEQIADIISSNLMNKAKSWNSAKLEFSPEGKSEIISYHVLIIKQFNRAIEVFQNVNLAQAETLKKKLKSYNEISLELERNHYTRLMNKVDETVSSSKTHLELLEMFKQISQHSTNIGRILIKWTDKGNRSKKSKNS